MTRTLEINRFPIIAPFLSLFLSHSIALYLSLCGGRGIDTPPFSIYPRARTHTTSTDLRHYVIDGCFGTGGRTGGGRGRRTTIPAAQIPRRNCTRFARGFSRVVFYSRARPSRCVCVCVCGCYHVFDVCARCHNLSTYAQQQHQQQYQKQPPRQLSSFSLFFW